jgi:hypothetical protein
VRKLKIRELVARQHGKRSDALMAELQILEAAVAGITIRSSPCKRVLPTCWAAQAP